MTNEIRDLRVKWQNQKQALHKADYNHADEELARALYFADNTPIISNIFQQLRLTSEYQEFSAENWLNKRGDADVMGAGQTNLNFSLDDFERAAQCLKVLELAVARFNNRQDGLYTVGITTYGGSSSKLIVRIRSAIEVIFDPFFHYVDSELRSCETLVTPTDIMREVQSLVDSATSTRYPNTHKLLTDTYRQLFNLSATSTGESWNQVGYNCRHVLIQFASEIFDPSYVPEKNEQPKGDDAKEKLKWTVRYFLRLTNSGNRYREALESIVKANWDFINSLGHRQKSATEYDAHLSVTYTYLTISIVDDVISRTDEENRPQNVVAS